MGFSCKILAYRQLTSFQILDSNCWFTMRFPLFQEQIAACHEFDGVRKEKERLTAAYWSRELQLHLTDLFFTGISFTVTCFYLDWKVKTRISMICYMKSRSLDISSCPNVCSSHS